MTDPTTHLIINDGVYRTAPATPSLLKKSIVFLADPGKARAALAQPVIGVNGNIVFPLNRQTKDC